MWSSKLFGDRSFSAFAIWAAVACTGTPSGNANGSIGGSSGGSKGGGSTKTTTGVSQTFGGAGASGGLNATGSTQALGGTTVIVGSKADSGTSGNCTKASSYDQLILCDNPVGYWAMNRTSGTEPDLTNEGRHATHKGPPALLVSMPNGDRVSQFDGSTHYVTIPSSPGFSIPTTGNLTWEAWIRPDVLQFPNHSGGYVDWMGKCEEYSPSCEWEARMYNLTNSQDRFNRLSAYAFNPTAGLGSGADWQPSTGQIMAGEWYHVVGEYTTLSQPSNCNNASAYPGSIEIWVNGVQWNHASHGQTGCMSQYNVVPVANDSAVNVGTMARDAWFQGAIGKLAIYDYLLSQAQIAAHYELMTGKQPTGSCANTCSF